MAIIAFSWSTWSLLVLANSAPNRSGAAFLKSSSFFAIGWRDLLRWLHTFSRLRRDILALAFPSSSTAVVVAFVTASSVNSSSEFPASSSAVRGAMLSRTNVCQLFILVLGSGWDCCLQKVVQAGSLGGRHLWLGEPSPDFLSLLVWYTLCTARLE